MESLVLVIGPSGPVRFEVEPNPAHLRLILQGSRLQVECPSRQTLTLELGSLLGLRDRLLSRVKTEEWGTVSASFGLGSRPPSEGLLVVLLLYLSFVNTLGHGWIPLGDLDFFRLLDVNPTSMSDLFRPEVISTVDIFNEMVLLTCSDVPLPLLHLGRLAGNAAIYLRSLIPDTRGSPGDILRFKESLMVLLASILRGYTRRIASLERRLAQLENI